MPPSNPAPAGPPIPVPPAAPAGRGASYRSGTAAAGSGGSYRSGAGAQPTAAHTKATPAAARAAATSLAADLRRGPASPLAEVNGIGAPSKASRHHGSIRATTDPRAETGRESTPCRAGRRLGRRGNRYPFLAYP